MIPRSVVPVFSLLLAAVVLAGCARREEAPEAGAQEPGADAVAAGAPSVQAPPPVVDGVEVEVVLTGAAASRLQAVSGRIVVEAEFVGDPNATGQPQANQLGMVELGSGRVELEGAGTAVFPEDLIDRSRLDLIEGQPQVMVNTTAAGPGVPRGLLACTYFWETLGVAGGRPVEITCDLPQPE